MRAAETIERQGYRVGALAFVTRFDQASALVDMLPVSRVPHAPQWLVGLVNWHGYPVPVFDLAPLAELPHESVARRMLLMFGEGDALAGLVINGVPQRLRFADDDRVAATDVPPLFTGYVGTAYRSLARGRGSGSESGDADVVWLELDVVRLFEDLASTVAETEGQPQ
ncbi:MAG: chemotaxis protein CheW [Burkholderiales bacterium]